MQRDAVEIIVIIAIVPKFIKKYLIWTHNLTGNMNTATQVKTTVKPLINTAKVMIKKGST